MEIIQMDFLKNLTPVIGTLENIVEKATKITAGVVFIAGVFKQLTSDES